MVTYCNKNFVVTNDSNNIFCCNKVFLIIIKIFYFNKTLLQRNFCYNSLLSQQNFFCCNRGLLQQFEVYCNKNPPNAILRYFDDYLMDDVGHVAANNDDNVVYND